MRIETNQKLIRRNAMIARYASIIGLLVLIAGMVISFTRPALVSLSFAALIIGFLLSQLGIYYTTRWGRQPRPDQLLNQALKGLDNKYHLYHYTTPVSHLLVGPAGVWALFPRPQRGVITYEKGRWRQKGGGVLQTYMRIFAQEGLGRPDVEIASEVQNLYKYLEKKLGAENVPEIQAALIFVNERAEIQLDEANPPPIPTIYLSKLKELIRKTAKGKPISMDKVQQIQQLFSTREATEEED